MKRGFTLIELLAVIVILAIIALIATPIILGIINDAKAEAKERTAELIETGVEYAYATAAAEAYSTNTDLTLEKICAKVNVKNTTVSCTNEFKIESSEGVTVVVTEAEGGMLLTYTGIESKTTSKISADLNAAPTQTPEETPGA